jgi:polysaccharide biosynthesis protein PslH
VCVAPMRVARGIQNKVLEGMAMGKVVITTAPGFDGIDAVPSRDLLLADNAAAFIAATIGALTATGPASMGERARSRIVDGYGWDDKLAAFERLLLPPGERA